jgi:acyl carrier protein
MPATVNKDQIEERLVEALVSFGAERESITRDAGWESLDVDSLDLVELAQIVEDDYGVQMKEADLKQIETVGQAIDFVAERAGSS